MTHEDIPFAERLPVIGAGGLAGFSLGAIHQTLGIVVFVLSAAAALLRIRREISAAREERSHCRRCKLRALDQDK